VAQWRERLRWPLPIALILIAAICLPLGIVFDLSGLVAIGVAAAVVGGLLLLDAFGLTTDPILRPQDPAEVRVKRLLDALAETTKVIAAVESEVAARSKLAERLQEDIARNRELIALDRPEVEAVAQTFRLEVRREGRRTLLENILLNAFFFGLGVLVTFLLT
jgi:hypothetical protein